MTDIATPTELSAAKGEGQTIETTPAAVVQTLSTEDRLAQMEKTNQRLLNESKENKAKYQMLKEEQDKKEKELLTQKENWKELLEREKTDHEGLKDRFKKFKQKTISKTLEHEILKYAPEVQDVHLVKQALPIDTISVIEEDDELKFSGLQEGIDKIKKEKSFLFKTNTVPTMTSVKPGSPTVKSLNGAAPKTVHQMTRDELKAYWQANPQLK